ncbi:MAG TPA: cysteine desulfurase NifS [Myxococcales bacterium]|nr:cysteine desulfurase NifS [Myxococcales bacterium]
MNAVYLDNHATTALDPQVMAAMRDALPAYGNPSSLHGHGRTARKALLSARQSVAEAMGARQREIVFTSGGTEANNLALRSAYQTMAAQGRRRVITSSVEHAAVLETVATLPEADVVIIPVDDQGALEVAALEEALSVPTAVVSIMAANNETGVLFDVDHLAELARGAGALFHSDAVQVFGKGAMPQNADLVAVSAHKIHGPKGVGALQIRKGLELPPLHSGGHQERGRRGGTENTLGIIGFGVAAQLIDQMDHGVLERIENLRDRLESSLLDQVDGAQINGGLIPRLPTVSNIHFPGLEGEAMVIALDMEGVALSSGSACSSGTMEPSHVLLAMGLSYAAAGSSLRFSLSRLTTEEEVEFVSAQVPRVAQRLLALGL